MEAGDTFKFGRTTHLWVVVSDPSINQNCIVIANMSSDRGIDRSCILQPGDHPFVNRPTCIMYSMARVVTNAELEKHVSSNIIRLQERVSPDILDRIRQGAAVTDQIPFKCKQILIDQCLIEP